ncbi:MAG: hypothetical protein ABH950_02465 [Candidatus Altiarchaeota archaeon]
MEKKSFIGTVTLDEEGNAVIELEENKLSLKDGQQLRIATKPRFTPN